MKKAILAAFLVLLPGLAAAQVPKTLHFNGLILTRQGDPVPGPITLRFRIYAQSAGGNTLWEEPHLNVVTDNGAVSLLLGNTNELQQGVFSAMPRYLGIQVGNNDEMTPRYVIASTPFAFLAESARNLEGADGATCSAYQVIKRNGQNDGWVCAPDDDAGGTVTSVGTGPGLTGGPITGTGTLSIAPGGVTPAMLAACAAPGQILKWGGSAWACTADDTGSGSGSGTVKAVIAGAGLTGGTITESGTLSIAPEGVTGEHLALDKNSLFQVSGGVMSSSANEISIGTGSHNSGLWVNGTLQATVQMISPQLMRGGDSAGIKMDANHDLILRAGSADIVHVKNDGKVGIGTVSPQERLDVGGNIRASLLAGSGSRCVYTDGNGVLRAKGSDCGTASGAADDLGSHAATQNISLGSNWLSGDGGNEGIKVGAEGELTLSSNSITSTAAGRGFIFDATNITSAGGQFIAHFSRAGIPKLSIGHSGDLVFQDSTLITASNSNPLRFATGPSYEERVRISEDGMVGIGTESPLYRLHVSMAHATIAKFERSDLGGAVRIGGNVGMPQIHFEKKYDDQFSIGNFGNDLRISRAAAIGTNDLVVIDAVGNVSIASLVSNGPVYSNNSILTNTNPSSRQYKKDIRPADLKPERLLKLKPKHYTWKNNGQKDMGFIAEEVWEALPELKRDDGRTRGYDLAKLPFYLVELARKQKSEIDALKAQNRTLLAMMKRLARQVRRITR